ncbi:Rho GTPase-activating protein 2 [Striga hermonthica]|uniref:Rho GTPase-activating protein 2 n=1 Tax=Striga hermonthica TaxID=68872 RepID=A0A9N7N1L9_STRHE|nr:Rho GTPase-activating protein 2 [Striga hermonthica]
MQCSYDNRGNSVPTILLLMQERLYSQGLIKAWFRELPAGVLDGLSLEQVLQCNIEQDSDELIKQLKPTESGLLSWAVKLMADVVEQEDSNKINARNIAMVFAPNMTQVAAEDRRRRTLIDKVPNMNNLDAAQRELRYHQTQQALLDQQAILHDHHGLFKGTLHAMLDNQRTTTLLQVMSARSKNQHIQTIQMNAAFSLLPKLYAGHLFLQPQPVQEGEY